MEDYLAVNKANWDSRVPIHLGGYSIDKFHADENYLSDVVRFNLPHLPNLVGLNGIHLQSHIGTDTLSLVRLGAQMTALDFSLPALEAASSLAKKLGHELQTVHCDVYSTPTELNGRFDFVYTGVGALCWLPSIDQWARVVGRLLKPGGFLFIRESHPMLWTIIDSRPNGDIAIDADYFEGQVWVSEEQETYAGEGKVPSPKSISFNHSLSEILNALRKQNLQFELFEEHSTVPYNPLGEEFEKLPDIDEWQLKINPRRLAASYTLLARKDH